jgi:hypothetical protein
MSFLAAARGTRGVRLLSCGVLLGRTRYPRSGRFRNGHVGVPGYARPGAVDFRTSTRGRSAISRQWSFSFRVTGISCGFPSRALAGTCMVLALGKLLERRSVARFSGAQRADSAGHERGVLPLVRHKPLAAWTAAAFPGDGWSVFLVSTAVSVASIGISVPSCPRPEPGRAAAVREATCRHGRVFRGPAPRVGGGTRASVAWRRPKEVRGQGEKVDESALRRTLLTPQCLRGGALKMTPLSPWPSSPLFWKDEIGLSLSENFDPAGLFSLASVVMEYPSGYVQRPPGIPLRPDHCMRLRLAGWGFYLAGRVVLGRALAELLLAFATPSSACFRHGPALFETPARRRPWELYGRCDGRMVRLGP